MPPPLAAGFILGPGAVGAAKHVAIRAAAYIDVYAATSASIAAILARLLWKKIPNWIKQDISFRNLLKRNNRRKRPPSEDFTNDDEFGELNDSNNGREELSHLGSVIDKLAAYADAAKIISPVPQLHAAVLAYIQLSGQLKLKQQELQNSERQEITKNEERSHKEARFGNMVEDSDEADADHDHVEDEPPILQEQQSQHFRDTMYRTAGEAVSLQDVIYNNVELQESLNFATWAYYEDTAKLEAQLEEMDFVLLEHTMEENDVGVLSSQTSSPERLPGTVDYYVALSTKRKQLVVGIKGTSTLEELLTDCCGKAVPLHNGLHYYGRSNSSSVSDSNCIRSDSIHHDLNAIAATSTRVEVIAKQPNAVLATSENGSDIVEVVSGHERINIENHDDHGDNCARCHEGILISARKILTKIQPLIERYLIDMNDNKGSSRRDEKKESEKDDKNSRCYRLLLCGHSLGAGAAVLTAALLRLRLPQLFPATANDAGFRHHDIDQPKDLVESFNYHIQGNGNMVHVYAFAPPPVLDHDSAIAASSYCTTVINNADIIPRCSLVNLLVFMEFLRAIHDRLEEKGMNPTGPITTTTFLKKLSQGTSSIENSDLLLTLEEASTAMKEAYDMVELRHPDHLYVPGRVLLVYRPWCTNKTEQKTDENSTLLAPSSSNETNDFEHVKMPTPDFECIMIDGTAPVLRIFEIDGIRMFTDHVTSSYYDLLGSEYNF